MFGFSKKNEVGYNQSLCIFIMDHRTSFLKKTLEIDPSVASVEDWEEVKNLKKLIFNGYISALISGVPAEQSAFFIDEQTGETIIEEANNQGLKVCLAVEKSGQTSVEFEYGEDFRQHINKFKPKFVKLLVRYNPEHEESLKQKQIKKLLELNYFAREANYKLILEVRIEPTVNQLTAVLGEEHRYDLEIRPQLACLTVAELRNLGVDPDIWHMEGFETEFHYANLIENIKKNGRSNVGMVIMSRGAAFPQVENWLKVGAGVKGVIGFSVGRTAFQNAIKQYKSGNKSMEDVTVQIAQNYMHFYQIFNRAKID